MLWGMRHDFLRKVHRLLGVQSSKKSMDVSGCWVDVNAAVPFCHRELQA